MTIEQQISAERKNILIAHGFEEPMSIKTKFSGFSEPLKIYYRLPNNWHQLWILIRAYLPTLAETESNGENKTDPKTGSHIVALIKFLEYVIKHTWGFQRFDAMIWLSASDFHSGRRHKGCRVDNGVGLSENAVREASKTLEKLGLLSVASNDSDKARRKRYYKAIVNDETAVTDVIDSGGSEVGKPFHFSNPLVNYFKVGFEWIHLQKFIKSAATILLVEYFFRYAWGYNNPRGVWMSAEEVANGRKYSNGTRYDSGIGFDISTIYRALNGSLAK